MTHNIEYKRALAPMEQQAARIDYEIRLIEKEVYSLAEIFNPGKPDERIARMIEGKMFEMKQKTDELLSINLNVYKIRE